MLTQERLKKLVNYDHLTGVFTWKCDRSNKTKKGDIAGSVESVGYRLITVDYSQIRAHRLAFLYMLGYLPEGEVDHIDRFRGNDAWENLREVSRSCNRRNTGNPKNNTSGVKGVSFCNRNKKWLSVIFSGRTFHLGYREEFIEAVCLRLAAEQCLDWSGCDDSSPAYKFVKENIKNV